MSDWYVKEFMSPSNESSGGVILANEETGETQTIDADSYSSVDDFLDEVYGKTQDIRFNPDTVSRMVMEKVAEYFNIN